MQRQRGELVPSVVSLSGSARTGVPIARAYATNSPSSSRWNRILKKPPEWIIKLMRNRAINELVDWVRDLVQQLFQRVRTAPEAHGRNHAA